MYFWFVWYGFFSQESYKVFPISLIESDANLLQQVSPSSDWDDLESFEYSVDMDINKSDMTNFCHIPKQM